MKEKTKKIRNVGIWSFIIGLVSGFISSYFGLGFIGIFTAVISALSFIGTATCLLVLILDYLEIDTYQ